MALCLVDGLLGSHQMVFLFLYLQNYGISLVAYSLLENLSMGMMMFNPLFGFVTDRFALLGSKRKAYLVLAGCVGAAGYSTAALTSWVSIPLGVVIGFQFVIEISNSFRAVVLDAMNVSIHNFRNAHAGSEKQMSTNSALMTVFGAKLIGKVLSNIFFGAVYYYFRSTFLFFNAFVALISVAIACWTVELTNSPSNGTGPRGSFSLGQSIRISVARVREARISRLVLADFVSALSPNLEAGIKFFMVGVLKFTNTDFLTRMVFSEGFFLLGILAMGTVLKKVSRKSIIRFVFASNVLWNLVLIVIINHYASLFLPPFALMTLYSGIFALLLEMRIIPFVGVFMDNCPPGLEAFFLSILMLVVSIGRNIGGFFGTILFSLFSVTSTNFDNFDKIIYIRSAFLFIAFLVLLSASIPERRITPESPNTLAAEPQADILHKSAIIGDQRLHES